MIHDVIGLGIEDGSKQVGHSLLYMKFKSGMTKAPVKYSLSQEHSECKRLDWIQNGSQRKYPRLNNSLLGDNSKEAQSVGGLD